MNEFDISELVTDKLRAELHRLLTQIFDHAAPLTRCDNCSAEHLEIVIGVVASEALQLLYGRANGEGFNVAESAFLVLTGFLQIMDAQNPPLVGRVLDLLSENVADYVSEAAIDALRDCRDQRAAQAGSAGAGQSVH